MDIISVLYVTCVKITFCDVSLSRRTKLAPVNLYRRIKQAPVNPKNCQLVNAISFFLPFH